MSRLVLDDDPIGNSNFVRPFARDVSSYAYLGMYHKQTTIVDAAFVKCETDGTAYNIDIPDSPEVRVYSMNAEIHYVNDKRYVLGDVEKVEKNILPVISKYQDPDDNIFLDVAFVVWRQ